MIDHAASRPVSTAFEVRVGHVRVTVAAESREDAVIAARRRFCDEMPRMWDVIQTLADEKFEVEEKRN